MSNCKDNNYKILHLAVRAINLDNLENLVHKRYEGPWSKDATFYCQAAPPYLYYILTGIGAFVCITAIVIYAVKWMWRQCKQMRDIEVKLPGSLEQAQCDVGMSQWPGSGGGGGLPSSLQGHKGGVVGGVLSHTSSPAPRIRTADEQLLLEGGRGDSSGCSSGHESVISSIASAGASDDGSNAGTGAASDSGTEQPTTPDHEDERCSGGELRLRKAATPGYCVLGVADGGAPIPLNSGYVPVPKTAAVTDSARRGYVQAARPEPGYSSVVPTSTLINIDGGLGGGGECVSSGNAAAPVTQRPTAGSLTGTPLHVPTSPAYVKTEPTAAAGSGVGAPPADYLLSSYCRLGLDGKTVNTDPQPLAPPLAKGYVPHKHYDSKMLKGD